MKIEETVKKTFLTKVGEKEIRFKVLKIKAFPADKVKNIYKHILQLSQSQLVGIPVRTGCLPNLTAEDGVAQLTSIEIDGQVINKSGLAICTALGIAAGEIPRTATLCAAA